MEDVNEEVQDNDDNNNDNADNNGAVAGDSSSSRRMKILRPRYYYIDVGSTNGTIYNGVALVPNVKLELKHGMEIKVGNSLLQMEIL
jgi:predicted component of type VI protein secretion system